MMTALEKEYGDALYSLAMEENCPDEVLEGLSLAVAAFQENPGYLTLVQNPALPKEERLGLLDKAFEGVHTYVLRLLKLLCERSALSLAPGALEQFKSLLYAERGILPVEAITAVPLTEEQQKALMDKLAAKTGKTILLETRLDPSVLGGVKLRYEGKELDGTAAGRLSALRRALTQA